MRNQGPTPFGARTQRFNDRPAHQNNTRRTVLVRFPLQNLAQSLR